MTPLGGAKHRLRQVSDTSTCFTSRSPDSRMIAYDGKPEGEKSGIFLMPPVGSPAARLTTAQNGMFDAAPAFSPDGKQIAFVRTTDDGRNPAIYLVPAAGGEEEKLTAFRGIRRLTWTADGRRSVFGAIGLFVGENPLYSVAANRRVAEGFSFISADAFQPPVLTPG